MAQPKDSYIYRTDNGQGYYFRRSHGNRRFYRPCATLDEARGVSREFASLIAGKPPLEDVIDLYDSTKVKETTLRDAAYELYALAVRLTKAHKKGALRAGEQREIAKQKDRIRAAKKDLAESYLRQVEEFESGPEGGSDLAAISAKQTRLARLEQKLARMRAAPEKEDITATMTRLHGVVGRFLDRSKSPEAPGPELKLGIGKERP
tara:strand:+ start:391 stop:1008 length:618 start_codon:yes stop_codon:yes gene_type:complete